MQLLGLSRTGRQLPQAGESAPQVTARPVPTCCQELQQVKLVEAVWGLLPLLQMSLVLLLRQRRMLPLGPALPLFPELPQQVLLQPLQACHP